jgi:hypothetical protein
MKQTLALVRIMCFLALTSLVFSIQGTVRERPRDYEKSMKDVRLKLNSMYGTKQVRLNAMDIVNTGNRTKNLENVSTICSYPTTPR